MNTSLRSASKRLILAGCIGAMLLACNHLGAGVEGAKPADRVKQLRQEQLAVLEEIQQSAEHRHQEGEVSYEDLSQAKMAVFQARLALAETAAERIGIHEEIVREAESLYRLTSEVGEVGDVTQHAVMLAKVRLLEQQIELEKEKQRAEGQ